MKLDVKAFALACGILWGGLILLVDVSAQIWSGYGLAFLGGVASIYPGYDAALGFGSALIGAGYGLIDGAIAGLILAWIYNLIAR